MNVMNVILAAVRLTPFALLDLVSKGEGQYTGVTQDVASTLFNADGVGYNADLVLSVPATGPSKRQSASPVEG